MATAGEAVQYLRWRKEVADHDYAAASSYLSIRYGESRAQEVSDKLHKLPVIQRRANDILRATQRLPLPMSDPGVLRDLQKVLAGEKLSPGFPRLRARPLRGRAAQARLTNRRSSRQPSAVPSVAQEGPVPPPPGWPAAGPRGPLASRRPGR
jgi:hypothetical protein